MSLVRGSVLPRLRRRSCGLSSVRQQVVWSNNRTPRNVPSRGGPYEGRGETNEIRTVDVRVGGILRFDWRGVSKSF